MPLSNSLDGRPMKLGSVLPLAMLGMLLSVPAAAITVCADPDYLPYSNRSGEGFENKIALAVGNALKEKVQYTWASHRGHGGVAQFPSSHLDAREGDVGLGILFRSRQGHVT